MKTLLKKLILVTLAGTMLASCASLVGPRDIDLPLEKLQSSLDRRFPTNNRMLDLFQVELSRPQLSVQHDSERLGLTLDASIAPSFLRQSWRGNLAVSGRLVIDPGRNAVLMAEPRVDRFAVDGVDETSQRQLGKVANQLLATVVDGVPLYHFRPEDLRYAGVQYVPTRITTTRNGLRVSVEPAK